MILKVEYDKLQLKYGAKELISIYNGGRTDNPNICFIFMNSTGCRKQNFFLFIDGKQYKVYPVYYPIGNGMMNIDKAIEDLDYIITTNLRGDLN